MRFIAKVKIIDSNIKKLMINDCKNGVFLFEYDIIDDGSYINKYTFGSLEAAFEFCKEDYGIIGHEWKQIPDPLEQGQQDCIAPVRAVGRSTENPQLG